MVTCEGLPLNTARFWEFQFDVETKLPIRARVWFTADRQGDPHWDITRFTYNPVLPADAFTLKIPAGAQVVDCRALRSVVSADVGLPVGDADPHQACRLAVEAYWHAVIGQDWERARRLRPFPDDSAWEGLKTLYRGSQPVELPKVQFTEHVSDPGALEEVGSLIKLSSGRTVESILNVEIARSDDGRRRAMIVGSLGPEFIGIP